MTDIVENNPEMTEMPVNMTAGEMLRNARTTGRRKRELSTIAKQLCIREEFLDALENCNYTVIPEMVYILGFARNYAMELGLNPDEVVAKIKQEMGVDADCAKNADDDDVSACAMPSIKEESWGKIWLGKIYQFVYQNWIWFAGGAVAVVLIVMGLVLLGGEDKNAEILADTTVVVETVQESNEPEYKQSVRERFGAKNRETARIIMQANQKTGEAGTWVEVKDSRGRTELSRVLMPGDVYYVPVKGKYKATFGNAGGIDIWVDGQLVPQIGDAYTKKSGVELDPEKLMQKKSDKK